MTNPIVTPNPEGEGGPSEQFEFLLGMLQQAPFELSVEGLRQPAERGDLSGVSMKETEIAGVKAYAFRPLTWKPNTRFCTSMAADMSWALHRICVLPSQPRLQLRLRLK